MCARCHQQAHLPLATLLRTDDLFSDPTADHEAKLLLEKNTHIALRIQLDKSSGKVNVNDQPLDVTDHKGATLTGLKVDVSLWSSFQRMTLLMDPPLDLPPTARPRLAGGVCRRDVRAHGPALSRHCQD